MPWTTLVAGRLSCGRVAWALAAGCMGLVLGGALCGLAGSRRRCQAMVAMFLSFASASACLGATLAAAELLVVAGCLVTLSLVDAERRVIPDGALLTMVVAHSARLVLELAAEEESPARVLRALATDALLPALVLMAFLLVAAFVLDRMLGGRSVGGGDVKLLGATAFCLGLRKALVVLCLACALGLAGWLLRTARLARASGERRRAFGTAPRTFAWGPSIAVAFWVVVVLGSLS